MSYTQFFPVPPPDIPLFIDRITPGLAQIERPDGFTDADLFEQLKNGWAFLFLLLIDGKYSGFVVLKEIAEYGTKRLHIWLTFSPSHLNVLEVFNDDIEQCAQRMSASSISFSSSRPAWQRVAPRHGFTPRETVYSRPVKTQYKESNP